MHIDLPSPMQMQVLQERIRKERWELEPIRRNRCVRCRLGYWILRATWWWTEKIADAALKEKWPRWARLWLFGRLWVPRAIRIAKRCLRHVKFTDAAGEEPRNREEP